MKEYKEDEENGRMWEEWKKRKGGVKDIKLKNGKGKRMKNKDLWVKKKIKIIEMIEIM